MEALRQSLAALVALAVAVVGAASDLLAAGAIRPDHELKFSALRTSLDQLSDAATAAQALADADQPENPDAEAFAKLRADLAEARGALLSGSDLAKAGSDLVGRIETLAMTVDHMSDKLDALLSKKA